MKKVKESKKEVSVEGLARMITRNFPKKNDVKTIVNDVVEEKLVSFEKKVDKKFEAFEVKVDKKFEVFVERFDEKLKKYATREELYQVKEEIIGSVNSNTQKIINQSTRKLVTLLKLQHSSNEKRFQRLEEKVL